MSNTFNVPSSNGYTTDLKTKNSMTPNNLVNTPTTLTAEGVMKNTPMVTPAQIPSTNPEADVAFIDSAVTQPYISNEERTRNDAEKARNSSGSELVNLQRQLEGTSQIQEDIYKEQGVDDLSRVKNSLSKQLSAEKDSLFTRIESLKKTFHGSPAGLQAAINSATSESLTRQYKAGVALSAATGDWETATAIADRQVQAKIEPMKARLQTLQFIYQENKEAFNRSDDKLWSKKMSDEKREMDKVEKDENTLKDTRLSLMKSASEQEAPQSVQQAINDAKTPEEAIRAAGRYGGDILDRQLKQAQLSNVYSTIAERDNASIALGVNPKVLNTTQFKAAQAAQNLKKTLEKAKKLVETYGNYESSDAYGKGQLNSIGGELRSVVSTALDQGVVQPGEQASFDKLAGQFQKSIFIRNKVSSGAIDNLLTTTDNRLNIQSAALEGTYGVSRDKLDALLGVVEVDNQEFQDMDAIVDEAPHFN